MANSSDLAAALSCGGDRRRDDTALRETGATTAEDNADNSNMSGRLVGGDQQRNFRGKVDRRSGAVVLGDEKRVNSEDPSEERHVSESDARIKHRRWMDRRRRPAR